MPIVWVGDREHHKYSFMQLGNTSKPEETDTEPTVELTGGDYKEKRTMILWWAWIMPTPDKEWGNIENGSKTWYNSIKTQVSINHYFLQLGNYIGDLVIMRFYLESVFYFIQF